MPKYLVKIAASAAMTDTATIEAESPIAAAAEALLPELLQFRDWEMVDGGDPRPGSYEVLGVYADGDADETDLLPAVDPAAGRPAVTGSDTFAKLVTDFLQDWPQFGSDAEINGGDMLEYLGTWVKRAKAVSAAAAKSTESAESTPANSNLSPLVDVADLPFGTFRVYRLVDAWVRYETDVKAKSAEEAWDLAHNAGPYGNGLSLKWVNVDTSEFDHSMLGVEGSEGTDIIEPREE